MKGQGEVKGPKHVQYCDLKDIIIIKSKGHSIIDLYKQRVQK